MNKRIERLELLVEELLKLNGITKESTESGWYYDFQYSNCPYKYDSLQCKENQKLHGICWHDCDIKNNICRILNKKG